jgi:hypothetical protein
VKEAYRKPYFKYIHEAEAALKTLRFLFGDDTWQIHQRTVGYLEGWIAGARFIENNLGPVGSEE